MAVRRPVCLAASAETLGKVQGIIAEQLGTDSDKVGADSKFVDLGADSLDTVEIMMALEEEFDISIDEEGAWRPPLPPAAGISSIRAAGAARGDPRGRRRSAGVERGRRGAPGEGPGGNAGDRRRAARRLTAAAPPPGAPVPQAPRRSPPSRRPPT